MKAFTVMQFDTREKLVAEAAVVNGRNGQIIIAGGELYEWRDGAEAIEDLPNLVPAGTWTSTHFGAVGDGVTDCAPAFQCLFEWLEALDSDTAVTVDVPAGRYLLSSAIDFRHASTGSYFNRSVKIQGKGVDKTVFIIDNDTGGFLFEGNSNGRDDCIEVRDLTIYAARPGAGTGVHAILPGGGNRHERTLIMRDVELKPLDTETDYFNYGVYAPGNWRPLLDNVLVACAFTGDATEPFLDPEACIVLDYSYAPSVDRCHGWGGKYGLSLKNTNAVAAEGGKISRSKFVGNGQGIYVYHEDADTNEPALEIFNCHVNVDTKGIVVEGRKFVKIGFCLLYHLNSSTSATYEHIDLQRAEYVTIIANDFQYPQLVADRVGYITGVNITSGADRVKVVANRFRNCNTAVKLHAGLADESVSIENNDYVLLDAADIAVDSADAPDALMSNIAHGNAVITDDADGSLVGPSLIMKRLSDSPAANDNLGRAVFTGQNSAGDDIEYGVLRGVLEDPTAASESGLVDVFTRNAGVTAREARFGDGLALGSGSPRGRGTMRADSYYVGISVVINELGGHVPPSYDQDDFEDNTHAVNTTDKRLGAQYRDTTTGKILQATGTGVNNAWADALGVTVYTPATPT